uniref:NAD(+) kinase n=1 Tax=Chromera velia CCMP2878 TaxID=1169474 RepID=A0A0G4GI38_9ALVE|eukprot:Cvel_21988.t1-p1 / transcript=Cvel_21988.t1 / gene=Cvel_21988 / organism=Chromera_velia_CCMP2878 / gene_product=NAD kinase, putative / transcript_product=NAD kinase, putative / location=Cvel_scaffold2117:18621-28841(+) / protein_length=1769 / sequence_SO=supercontig / SO=protein_coding / is_pseudo=false
MDNGGPQDPADSPELAQEANGGLQKNSRGEEGEEEVEVEEGEFESSDSLEELDGFDFFRAQKEIHMNQSMLRSTWGHQVCEEMRLDDCGGGEGEGEDEEEHEENEYEEEEEEERDFERERSAERGTLSSSASIGRGVYREGDTEKGQENGSLGEGGWGEPVGLMRRRSSPQSNWHDGENESPQSELSSPARVFRGGDRERERERERERDRISARGSDHHHRINTVRIFRRRPTLMGGGHHAEGRGAGGRANSVAHHHHQHPQDYHEEDRQSDRDLDYLPRHGFCGDLVCHFKQRPRHVLVVKRLNSHGVTLKAVELANYFVRDLGITVIVEPNAADDFNANGAMSVKTWKAGMSPSDIVSVIDFVVCLGGDGTLLWVSGLFPMQMPPVAGIGMGSLGYLTQFEVQESKDLVRRMTDGTFNVCLRSRLRVLVVDEYNKVIGDHSAMNECTVDRGPSSYLCSMDVYLNGEWFTNVAADGLIVATPTGSTAYSMSAGGSMVHPNVGCMLFTPICPHTLSFRPVVLPDSAVLRIQVPEDARGAAWASMDGRQRTEIKRGMAVIIRMSPYPFPLVLREPASKTDHWLKSLKKGLNWNSRIRQLAFDPNQQGEGGIGGGGGHAGTDNHTEADDKSPHAARKVSQGTAVTAGGGAPLSTSGWAGAGDSQVPPPHVEVGGGGGGSRRGTRDRGGNSRTSGASGTDRASFVLHASHHHPPRKRLSSQDLPKREERDRPGDGDDREREREPIRWEPASRSSIAQPPTTNFAMASDAGNLSRNAGDTRRSSAAPGEPPSASPRVPLPPNGGSAMRTAPSPAVVTAPADGTEPPRERDRDRERPQLRFSPVASPEPLNAEPSAAACNLSFSPSNSSTKSPLLPPARPRPSLSRHRSSSERGCLTASEKGHTDSPPSPYLQAHSSSSRLADPPNATTPSADGHSTLHSQAQKERKHMQKDRDSLTIRQAELARQCLVSAPPRVNSEEPPSTQGPPDADGRPPGDQKKGMLSRSRSYTECREPIAPPHPRLPRLMKSSHAHANCPDPDDCFVQCGDVPVPLSARSLHSQKVRQQAAHTGLRVDTQPHPSDTPASAPPLQASTLIRDGDRESPMPPNRRPSQQATAERERMEKEIEPDRQQSREKHAPPPIHTSPVAAAAPPPVPPPLSHEQSPHMPTPPSINVNPGPQSAGNTQPDSPPGALRSHTQSPRACRRLVQHTAQGLLPGGMGGRGDGMVTAESSAPDGGLSGFVGGEPVSSSDMRTGVIGSSLEGDGGSPIVFPSDEAPPSSPEKPAPSSSSHSPAPERDPAPSEAPMQSAGAPLDSDKRPRHAPSSSSIPSDSPPRGGRRPPRPDRDKDRLERDSREMAEDHPGTSSSLQRIQSPSPQSGKNSQRSSGNKQRENLPLDLQFSLEDSSQNQPLPVPFSARTPPSTRGGPSAPSTGAAAAENENAAPTPPQESLYRDGHRMRGVSASDAPATPPGGEGGPVHRGVSHHPHPQAHSLSLQFQDRDRENGGTEFEVARAHSAHPGTVAWGEGQRKSASQGQRLRGGDRERDGTERAGRVPPPSRDPVSVQQEHLRGTSEGLLSSLEVPLHPSSSSSSSSRNPLHGTFHSESDLRLFSGERERSDRLRLSLPSEAAERNLQPHPGLLAQPGEDGTGTGGGREGGGAVQGGGERRRIVRGSSGIGGGSPFVIPSGTFDTKVSLAPSRMRDSASFLEEVSYCLLPADRKKEREKERERQKQSSSSRAESENEKGGEKTGETRGQREKETCQKKGPTERGETE